ncbi:hypothetical protein [Schumannella sp. 10F1B-5-1]|uniref:hypothetical protein n=1 Tax=Schumannella sp. 10F1B-5-1 TaxID=2590780 RepID=UPI001131F7B4|nr:hypothetical protein [Schumannella sp. 10F1B-5-1]TPW78383.1 hypothetical protein FJ658_00825 [Schumannella sp. 10F1B-5-1]
MTVPLAVIAAAKAMLNGDDSMAAAKALEDALVAAYWESDNTTFERVEGLIDALALYEPGGRAPYIGLEELHEAINVALRRLDEL